MKKVTLALFAMMFASLTFAQTAKKASSSELGIGVDGAFPIGDFSKFSSFGIGGTLKYAYNIDENNAITLTSGYINFSGKNGLGSVGYIPVKAGYRYTFPGNFYVEPQLGVTFATGEGSGSAFTYAGNIGYKFTPAIDLSARYEGFSKNSVNTSFIGVRLAYNFSLSGK
ncbi:MAG: outer membrane beta-barrel protein [Filimonas sp.]|nr:outer membrane beta-barrel protein [Filimonas sp.]